MKIPEHFPVTCYCKDCQKAENARQRKITAALVTILTGLLFLLWGEITK